MAAYAIALIRNARVGAELQRYLQSIDGTLEPFGGRYLVHAGRRTVMEGSWDADTVVVEFPSMDDAEKWYRSAAYQAILPLRSTSAETDLILSDGVPDGYRGSDLLARAR